MLGLGFRQFFCKHIQPADSFTNLYKFIYDVVLVVLDHAPVIGECSNSKPLIFTLATLQKQLAILTKKAKDTV